MKIEQIEQLLIRITEPQPFLRKLDMKVKLRNTLESFSTNPVCGVTNLTGNRTGNRTGIRTIYMLKRCLLNKDKGEKKKQSMKCMMRKTSGQVSLNLFQPSVTC